MEEDKKKQEEYFQKELKKWRDEVKDWDWDELRDHAEKQQKKCGDPAWKKFYKNLEIIAAIKALKKK